VNRIHPSAARAFMEYGAY